MNNDNNIGDLMKMMSMAYSRKEEGQSLYENISGTNEKVKDVVKNSVAVNDAYGNKLLSIGNQDESAKFTDYEFSNDTLNYTLWLSLYNDSWVFKRAIDKPAQDEIRCGIELIGEYDKDLLYKDLKKYRFDLIQLLQWGALFGGSVAVMMFDKFEDKDYAVRSKENLKKIESSKVMRMYVTDRWYGCAPSNDDVVTNMEDIDYGKPMYYDITFADGRNIRVHHDYILRYEHRVAPPLIKRGQLQGWGYAEGAHLLRELMRDDKLKSSIQSLMDKSLIEVIKMSGMRGVFMGTGPENTEQLRKRLEMVNWARNFNSLTFLDKDDDYLMNQFSGLSGLSDLLQQNMWQIAAALEMQGVLFGDLKSGFSNDTDALERYSETIKGRCESYVRPVYQKLLKMLFMKYKIEDNIEFEFNSLIMDKEDEDKVENISKYVALCKDLLDMGVLTTKQVGEGLVNYTKNGTIDFGITEQSLNELDDKFENEMENIDLENEVGKVI